MLVKVLYAGLQTGMLIGPLQLGVGAMSVWINNAGFTSASNDLGTLGGVYLDAPEIEVPADLETEAAFQDLDARIVTFEITPSKFFHDGGIARIKMTLPGNGSDPERSLAFSVSGCRGVAITVGTLVFTIEMSQMDRTVAEVTGSVSEDDFVAMVDAVSLEGQDSPA